MTNPYQDQLVNNIFTCICGNTYRVTDGTNLSDKPYEIPVCPACLVEITKRKAYESKAYHYNYYSPMSEIKDS